MMAAMVGHPSDPVSAPAEDPGVEVGRVRRSGRFLFGTLPSLVLGSVRWAIGAIIRGLGILFRPLTLLFDSALSVVSTTYPKMLAWSLRSRGLVLAVSLSLLGFTAWLAPQLGVDLIPSFSQGEFSFRVELPEGTPLEVADRFVADIQNSLDELPQVDTFTSITGGSGLSLGNTGSEGENFSLLSIRMKPEASAADEQHVISRVRERLASSGLARFEMERPSFFSFRTPIEVEVYSDRLGELNEATATLAYKLARIPGLVDVRSSSELGNPELQVRFDRGQIARLGLDLSEIVTAVRSKVQGEVATRFTQADREIDIRVRAIEIGEATVADISDLIVTQREGRPIYLSSLATVELTEGPSEIRRLGQKRAAVISGNLDQRDMAAVAADVRTVLSNQTMPAGVTASLSGQEEEMQRSLRSMVMAMALAVFLVYLVMASQFESFLHPFVIIFSLPLGAVGVVAALALTGQTINVVALIGAVMLAGIVVNNAIVLVDAVNQRRRAGMPLEAALIEAGSHRLRPILMTSATTVFGLLPMALGLGEGAELRAPLAITVIGGLSVATLLTLFVIPVVYSLVERRSFATSPAVEPNSTLSGAVPQPAE